MTNIDASRAGTVAACKRLLAEMDASIGRAAWLDADAKALLDALAAIGPRPAGGEEIAAARSLLAERMPSAGPDGMREEEVAVPLWHAGRTALALMGPGTGGESWPVEALQLAGSGRGAVAAEAVGLATAAPEAAGWPTGEVAGKIAFVERVSLPEDNRHLRRLADNGAAAIVLVSVFPTGLPMTDYFGDEGDLPIPCVCVSDETGRSISRWLKTGGLAMSLPAEGYGEPAACANLIFDYGPVNEETVILGAHLDSFANIPGVFDNLTGVATAAEIARLLAPYRADFRRRLSVVFFTGEELHMLGSKNFVERRTAELDEIRFVLNIDSIFHGTAHGAYVMNSPEMAEYLRAAALEAGLDMEIRNRFCLSSDYLPFILRGIPACRPADLENAFPIWSHTVKDDRDHIHTDWIRHNAFVYARLLARLLTDPQPPPSVRLPRDEVRKQVNGLAAADMLRSMGFRPV